jgi:hypothetical protein
VFGHRYFGARYFGPRYFGDGGVAPLAPAEFPKYTLVGRGSGVTVYGKGYGGTLKGRGTGCTVYGKGFGGTLKGRGSTALIVARWRRMSLYQDLEFHLGEHWNVNFEVNDGNDANIDITSATIQFRVVTSAGTTAMTRTVGDGITITTAATGLCALSVTPTMQTTASIAAGRYKWEFRVTTTGGTITVQARGNLNVLPSLY